MARFDNDNKGRGISDVFGLLPNLKLQLNRIIAGIFDDSFDDSFE